MANALLVRCDWCSGEPHPCEGCELVEVMADRERLRQDNELLRHQLAQKATEMTGLWERLAAASAGIALRGWWCLSCDCFQGEEHSPRFECRRCGTPKKVMP